MNSKHAKTLAAIFNQPTRATVLFLDIENLLIALGAECREGAGSRVKFSLRGGEWQAHRPHPNKEAKKYQIEQIRELLQRLGIQP
jgi:hypothetical protein